jgi:ketosteroid isomerase-like protein
MNEVAMSDSAALSVADRIAIQDLIARYAWALDTGDVDALVRCFTRDCAVIEEVFEDPDRWEGHEGVR